MGKRIMCAVAVMLAGILVFPCFSIAASGGETTLTETDNLDVDVYAKAIYTWPENCYIAGEEDGSYTVETDDGTVITVTSENLDSSLRLVVYRITGDDSEAYAWIMECTEGLGSDRLPYEIYFIDESGNRVEAANASVVITLPDGYGTPSVYQVASSGTAGRMSSVAGESTVSFFISSSGFYMLMSVSDDDDAYTGEGTAYDFEIDEIQYRLVVVTELDSVSEDLAAAGIDTVETLKQSLFEIMTSVLPGATEGNTAYYEVTLMVKIDGKWQTADEEHFPSEGITVTLPYPEGTGRDGYEFTVVHMFSRSILGRTAGEYEIPAVTLTDDGLQMTLTGMSPVAVSWTETGTSQSETDEEETSQSDTDQSETSQSDTDPSETTQTETNQSETSQSETEQSETNQSETLSGETNADSTESTESETASETETDDAESEEATDSSTSSTDDSESETSGSTTAAQTGDDTPIWFQLTALLMSAAALAATSFIRCRRG
ncbi:MAG: hypothetical protein LUG93_03515 [Lachnospiraceae bacterium]|nr:hypothetical protein [Lachnospiraceae bacterium]